MSIDRARQNILATIMYESARLWKEKNPEALPFGWTITSDWQQFGTSKARLVQDPNGRCYEQVIEKDGQQKRYRNKDHDKAKTPL